MNPEWLIVTCLGRITDSVGENGVEWSTYHGKGYAEKQGQGRGKGRGTCAAASGGGKKKRT